MIPVGSYISFFIDGTTMILNKINLKSKKASLLCILKLAQIL